VIKKIYSLKIFGKLFHTLIYCLEKELSDCKSVLDLGCGPSSPLKYCKNIMFSVGVEAFAPYLERSQKNKVHTKYINGKIENLEFPEKSFDAVIMIEVLEHLSQETGLKIIKKAEKWARKKIIVSTPNGFINQKEIDKNILQKHLSGWDYQKMKKLGFKIMGLAGLKVLRTEVQNETMGNDLTTSIKFKPKIFWFIVASLSQLLTYYFPSLAFELFSVKLLDEKK